MKSHRLLLAAAILAAVVTARAADPAPASAKATAKTPAARAVENAPENFPLTLRGFFGKGDKVEVSVQDKTSGKSVWLSPGSTHTGWKLESADASTGRAVFSQGTRRVNLFQAVESHGAPEEVTETAVPKLQSRDDSVVWKKLMELRQNPEFKKLWNRLDLDSAEALRKTHPEFFGKSGDFNEDAPGAIIAQMAEMKRMLQSNSTPEADSSKPVLNAVFDAVEKTRPNETTAGAPPKLVIADEILRGNTKEEISANHEEYVRSAGEARTRASEARNNYRMQESLRIFQLADELYRQRNAAK